MKSFTLLAVGSLAATANATFPHLDPRQNPTTSTTTTTTSRTSTSNLPATLVSECSSKYNSLATSYPSADPKVAEWWASALISGEATKTIVSACDMWDIRATATPPAAVSSQWSSLLSARESFARSKGPELLSLVSKCIPGAATATGMNSPGNIQVANLEQVLVTDKAGCESWNKKWYGAVQTVPKFTDTPARTRFNNNNNSTTTTSATSTSSSGAATTTTTTSAAGSTGAQTSPSPSGNGAVKETGLAAAMMVAVAGVMVLL